MQYKEAEINIKTGFPVALYEAPMGVQARFGVLVTLHPQ